jgi:hypothetical protein
MNAKHNHQVIFGRRVDGCPRCSELAAGAAPRQGWGATKRAADVSFRLALAKHDCKAAGCAHICTFGDW